MESSTPQSLPIWRVELVRERTVRVRKPVEGPADVLPILRTMLPGSLDRERVVAIYFDTRHQPIGAHVVSIGTLNASLVHPREVFKAAILANAAALIVAHNHPSGDPSPSAEDEALSERLRDAGRLLGIELLDHVVIAGRHHVSLREQNGW